MAILPKTLIYDVGSDLQDLAHQRVARACVDGALRLIDGVSDQSALVPHVAVVLVGREVAGWITRHYSTYGNHMFERQVEVVDAGGNAEGVEVSVDFFVPSSIKWRDTVVGDSRFSVGPLEIRKTLREARAIWATESRPNYTDHEEWNVKFAFHAESALGGLRVCKVERDYGARGADKGPRLAERFFAPPIDEGSGMWLALTLEQLERARECWRWRMARRLSESSAVAST